MLFLFLFTVYNIINKDKKMKGKKKNDKRKVDDSKFMDKS